MSIQLSPELQRAWTDIQKILAEHGITASDATPLDEGEIATIGWRVVQKGIALQWMVESGVTMVDDISIVAGEIDTSDDAVLVVHATVTFTAVNGDPFWYIVVSERAPRKPYRSIRDRLRSKGDPTGTELDNYAEGLEWVRYLIQCFQEHTKD